MPFYLLQLSGWRARHGVALAVLVVLLGLFPAPLANQTLVRLPALIQGELLANAEWPLGFAGVGRGDRLALLLTAPAAVMFIWCRRRELTSPHLGLAAGAVALWSLLVTLNPFLNHDVRGLGIVGRLDHLMYLQTAILIPSVIALSLSSAPKVRRALMALAVLFVGASMLSPLPRAARPQYLDYRVRMIQALPEVRQEVGGNPTVIAPHGDEFIVRWALGLRAQQKMSEDAQPQSTYWLLHRVPASTLTPTMAVVMEEDDICLTLVRAEELMPWLGSLTEQEQSHLLLQNLHLQKHLK